jgi:hypothetical protein
MAKTMMHGLTQNVRYSLRQIRKSPGFAAITVITLALGIGGNSAIFGVINAVMLRTLPVKDPGRLVLLKWKAKSTPKTISSSSYANCPPGSGPLLEGGDIISDVPLDSGGCSFSFPFFEQVQSERNIFSDVAAFVPAELSVNSEGRTSRVRGLFVSGDFFSTIGTRPAVGRPLDQHDDSQVASPTIVVSQHFWQSKLGGNARVLGQQISIGRTLFTVVGVTAPESAQLDPGLACDLWLPLAFKAKVPPYAPNEIAANVMWTELIGRLNPKTSTAEADSALSAAFAASTTTGPEAILKTADAPQIELATAAHGLATLRRNFSQALFALFAAVAMVLLISCVRYRWINVGAVRCAKKRTRHTGRPGCNARSNHFATAYGKSAPRFYGWCLRNGARSPWGTYPRIVFLAKLVDAAPTRRAP